MNDAIIKDSLAQINDLLRKRMEAIDSFISELKELHEHLMTIYDTRLARERDALLQSCNRVKDTINFALGHKERLLVKEYSSAISVMEMIKLTEEQVKELQLSLAILDIQNDKRLLRIRLTRFKACAKPLSWWTAQEKAIADSAPMTDVDQYFRENIHPTLCC